MSTPSVRDQLQVELEEYARQGELQNARKVLELILKLHPNDRAAQAELLRLDAGIRMHAAETKQQRNERKQQQARSNFIKEHQELSAKQLTQWPRKRLRLQLRHLNKHSHQDNMDWSKEEQSELDQAKKRLLAELQRREKLAHALFCTAAILLLLSLVGLLVYTQRNNVVWAAEELQHARQSEIEETLAQKLEKRPSAITRLLAPEYSQQYSEAQQWLQHEHEERLLISSLLEKLSQHPENWSQISTEEHTRLRGMRHKRDPQWEPLRQRWQRLGALRAESLKALRGQALQQVQKPWQASRLTGNIKHDESLLFEEKAQIQNRWERDMRLIAEHQLPERDLNRIERRKSEIDKLLRDITALQPLSEQLQTARNYMVHRAILCQVNGNNYPLNRNLRTMAAALPAQQNIAQLMHSSAQQKSSNLLAATRQTHLEGGPSFTPHMPANLQQIAIMEKIFSCETLNSPCVLIHDSFNNRSWLSKQWPTQKEESLQFTLHESDPQHADDADNSRSINMHAGIHISRIDGRPLLQALQLTRAQFFIHTRLSDTLQQLITFNNEQTPSLAKAYVLQQLFELMRAHAHPSIMGYPFSPLLQEDMKSFAALRTRCGIKLNEECWLNSTAPYQAAEQAFARWFAARIHRNYSVDIAQQLRALQLRVPRYIGFADAAGQAVLFEAQAPEREIWYLSRHKNALSVTPLQKADDIVPFSPIFISAPLATQPQAKP